MERPWFAEHHFDRYGGAIPSIAVIAAAAAMKTHRIRIGAGVAVLPLNSAIHLAEQFAMVDVLSVGRFDLGVGRGFMPHEFAGMGVDLATRQTRFDEGLEVRYSRAMLARPVIGIAQSQSGFNNGWDRGARTPGRGPSRGEAIFRGGAFRQTAPLSRLCSSSRAGRP